MKKIIAFLVCTLTITLISGFNVSAADARFYYGPKFSNTYAVFVVSDNSAVTNEAARVGINSWMLSTSFIRGGVTSSACLNSWVLINDVHIPSIKAPILTWDYTGTGEYASSRMIDVNLPYAQEMYTVNNFPFSFQEMMNNSMIHEFGHVFGLNDLQKTETSPSIMIQGVNLRLLGQTASNTAIAGPTSHDVSRLSELYFD